MPSRAQTQLALFLLLLLTLRWLKMARKLHPLLQALQAKAQQLLLFLFLLLWSIRLTESLRRLVLPLPLLLPPLLPLLQPHRRCSR